MSTRHWGIGLWLLGFRLSGVSFRSFSSPLFRFSSRLRFWLLSLPCGSVFFFSASSFLLCCYTCSSSAFISSGCFSSSSAPPLLSSSAPLLPSFAPGSSLSFRPSLSSTPSFPPAPHFAHPPAAIRPPSASALLFLSALGSGPGGSGISVSSLASATPLGPLPSVAAPSLFLPFALDSSSVPVSSAPLPSASDPLPSSDFAFPGPSSASFAPLTAYPYGPVEDLPADVALDALPRDPDSDAPAAVPDSARSKFRRMLAFVVDLFPQAAGSPSASPPPRALFEDFFGSSAPSSPIFLNWFERVRTALSDADIRMASDHSDLSFLPPRHSSYAIHGDFALGHAASVNPSLLSLFERHLKPSHHVGMSIREASALEGSF